MAKRMYDVTITDKTTGESHSGPVGTFKTDAKAQDAANKLAAALSEQLGDDFEAGKVTVEA